MIGIRPATPQDALPIARVHVETWRATYPTLLPHDYLVRHLSVETRAAQWQRTLQSGGAHEAVLVAEEAGSVIGFCSLGPARKKPKIATGFGERVGEIFTLYLLPDFQDQGVGRMLLANGFAALVEGKCDSALLWVLASNPSRFFYEAMGGRPAGRDVEKFAGADTEQICYFWPDLPASMTALASQTHRKRAQL